MLPINLIRTQTKYAREHHMTRAQKKVNTFKDLPETAVIKIAVFCTVEFQQRAGTVANRNQLVRQIIQAAQSTFEKKGLGTRVLLEVVG